MGGVPAEEESPTPLRVTQTSGGKHFNCSVQQMLWLQCMWLLGAWHCVLWVYWALVCYFWPPPLFSPTTLIRYYGHTPIGCTLNLSRHRARNPETHLPNTLQSIFNLCIQLRELVALSSGAMHVLFSWMTWVFLTTGVVFAVWEFSFQISLSLHGLHQCLHVGSLYNV